MSKGAFVIGQTCGWTSLRGLSAPICVISQLGDIHPFPNGPVITSETVVLDHCDKNFVFYWLKDRTFPSLKKLVLASHPCEPAIVYWMAERKDVEILVHEHWWRYIPRWSPLRNDVVPPHIQPITRDAYKMLLKEMQCETID
jgi:hypothetical protein